MQEIDVAEFAVDPRAPEWAGFREHYPLCADCSREVARFATLREALAGEVASASAHPSDAQLLALAAGPSSLRADERARLDAHLASCAPCRTELAVVRDFDPAAFATAGRRPGWLERLGGAIVFALARPALLAAAVALLVVPAALLVWRSGQETAPVSPPAAAVERSAPVAVAEVPPAPAAPTAPLEAAPTAETPPPPLPEPAPSLAKREPPPVRPAPAAPPAPTQVAKQIPAAQPPPATAKPAPQPELPAAKPSEPPRPIEIAALLPTDAPRYAPGRLADGPALRVGGAARGLGANAATPVALAPAQLGATSHESPNLYWFLPVATASPVEVTVVDPGAAAPLLETTIEGPLAPGVHRVSLAERGVRLEPGVDYQWFVALVVDPARRSQDVVTGGAIRHLAAGSELDARLSAAPPASAAHVYAESGLWYDAFDQLSTWLAAEPDASLLLEHRAALLEQVGLGDAAAFERRRASAER